MVDPTRILLYRTTEDLRTIFARERTKDLIVTAAQKELLEWLGCTPQELVKIKSYTDANNLISHKRLEPLETFHIELAIEVGIYYEGMSKAQLINVLRSKRKRR